MQVLQDFHKTLAALCLIGVALTACGERDREPTVTAQTLVKARALLEDAALTEAALDPETTSLWGLDTEFVPVVKARLSGTSQAAFERERLLRLDLQSRLGGAPNLPEAHPLARDILMTRLALQDTVLLQKSGKGHLRLGGARPHTIDPFGGLWIEGPQALVRDHVIETPADAKAYIARLAALADGVQDTRRRLIADAATGHLPPTDLLTDTRLKIEALLKDGAFESVIETLDDFSRGIPAGPARGHAERMTAARQIYQTNLLPAYADLVDTLKALETQAPIPPGLWTQPGGVTLYNDLLAVKAEPAAEAETLWQLLEEVSAAIRPAEPALENGVIDGQAASPPSPTTPPEAEPEPLDIPLAEGVLREGSALSVTSLLGLTTLPARLDDRRPVIIEWSPARLDALPLSLQSAITDTNRREAVALYAASVQTATRRSEVHAFRTDPAFKQAWTSYYQAGQSPAIGAPLFDLETVLAAVDIGIHARRWSLEDAVAFIEDKTALPTPLAREAALRIAANPAEAVGIYVHRERFHSLEERARQVLGTNFDLKAFHAVMLKDGPRPLPLVERDVDDWYQDLIAAR